MAAEAAIALLLRAKRHLTTRNPRQDADEAQFFTTFVTACYVDIESVSVRYN